MLTSRSFVKCTRRALYQNPFSFTFDYAHSYRTAVPLLHALENKAVGGHVRDLSDIANWAASIDRQTADVDTKRIYEARGGPLVRGQSNGWAWSVAILRACPYLSTVTLSVHTTSQVTKLIKPLRDVKSTLKMLKLVCMPLDLVVSLLASAQLSLDSLHLETLTAASSSNRGRARRLSDDVCEALIITSHQPLRIVLHDLLPFSSTRLRSLELQLGGNILSEEVLKLLQTLGRSLTTFKLALLGGRYWSRSLALYGRDHDGYDLPLDALTLLPCVRHLTFADCATISIARLSALGQNSPHLETMSFSGSIWVEDPQVNAALPETELDEALSSFPNLKSVDLGFVPLSPYSSLRLIEATARSRGWMLDYSGCGMYCRSCGDYH